MTGGFGATHRVTAGSTEALSGRDRLKACSLEDARRRPFVGPDHHRRIKLPALLPNVVGLAPYAAMARPYTTGTGLRRFQEESTAQTATT